MRKTGNITGKKTTGTSKGRLSWAKKAAAVAIAVCLAVCAAPMTAHASGAGPSAITQPLDNLKPLVISVIGAVGIIILAKNVMDVRSPYARMGLHTSSRTPRQ